MNKYAISVTDSRGNYSSSEAQIVEASTFMDAAHKLVSPGSTIWISSKPVQGGCMFKGQRVYRLTENRRLIVRQIG